MNPSMKSSGPTTRAAGGSETATPAAPPAHWVCECAWEVCNKLGGIYTVLRSKAPSMTQRWGDRYFMVGPYNAATAAVEFEPDEPEGPLCQAVDELNMKGIEARCGRWLVSGRPRVVLLNHLSLFGRLHEVKYRLWRDHHIALPPDDPLLNDVVAFGEACRELLWQVAAACGDGQPIIAHVHEWMAAAAIPMLRQGGWPGTIVFTTHATLLGRFLAMNDDQFYEHLPNLDALVEARRYQVEAQFRLERAAAHGAHVFTTVSDVTSDECEHLLGRRPELLLPNGLNIGRFTALHEFQNLHRHYKEKIHEFTIGHFFPSYSFDLDRTYYFYTSGRFEYSNKGMDVTIDALAKLNHRLRAAGSPVTVVMFIVTRRPVRSIDVTALHSRSMLHEFRTCVEAIRDQVGSRLFRAAAEGDLPALGELVDEYWLLRLRRAMHSWRRDLPPGILTHALEDDQTDPVLNQLRVCQLWNQPENPVKVIYHPDFIEPSNPLFGIEYEQFVRGCHLGLFPSYYEPWGYTPLESIALGVPAVTSDLSGFGGYVRQLLPDHEEVGLYVLERRCRSFHDTSEALADRMFRFCELTRRQRLDLRNKVERFSAHFDWNNLTQRYEEAYALALDRLR